jgi:hypothetical protein
MIASRAEIISSTVGGARLLFFKPDGLQRLDRDAGAPWRSFFAWFLCLPALFLFLQGLHSAIPLEDNTLRFYALWLLTSAVDWLAFPVLLLAIARYLPLRMRAPYFIQAVNWMSVPAQYVFLLASWFADSALLPTEIALSLGDIVLIWFLVVEGWLARRILSLTVGQALLLVLLHFMLGYALREWAIGRTLLMLAG